jgi:CRP/FNR family transcriptional regulator, anaerobic regulatory protein
MISPKHQIDIKTAFSEKIQSSFASILPYGKQKNITKGQFIIEKDEMCTKIFFIVEGIFRTFRESNEIEYTTGFSFKGDFDTSPFSFYYELPATETIEAITDATVLVFERKDFWEATKNNSELQNGVYLLLAGYIEILESRLHENRSMTAEQRYLQLLQAQPDDIKKISLGFIASFLGITKERLSRIRKKMH